MSLTNKIVIAIFCVVMSVPCFSAPKKQAAELSDTAIFRLSHQVYFKSDVLALLNSIKYFQCVFPQSQVFSVTKITRSLLAQQSDYYLPQELVEKLIVLEIIRSEIEGTFAINYSVLWSEIKAKNCLQSGPAGWSATLKGLFLLEHYLSQQWQNLSASKQQEEKERWLAKVSSKYKFQIFKYAL